MGTNSDNGPIIVRQPPGQSRRPLCTPTALSSFSAPYKPQVANASLPFTRGFPPPLYFSSPSYFPPVRAHRQTLRPFPSSPSRKLAMPSSHTIFFFSLNAVRVVGIISLILVFASSILVMALDIIAVNTFLQDAKTSGTPVNQLLEGCDYIENSSVPNQTGGIFWAVVNQLLIITQVLILILSECSWPMSAFDKFFPVLGTGFGLGPLGIFECLIGATILSHFVDDFTLVAAFFLFSIGCLNILLGLIFGVKAKQRRSIRAWRSGSDDILPPISEKRPPFARPDSSYMASFFKPSERQESRAPYPNGNTQGLGFGRNAEKAAGLKGFLISKPLESLPNYSSPRSQPRSTRSRPGSGSSIYSTSSANAPVPHSNSSYNAV